MKWLMCLAFGGLCAAGFSAPLRAQRPPNDACAQPPPGSSVSEPEELRSRNGVLTVELTIRNESDASGRSQYCYIYKDGSRSPTLRLSPGDLLVLYLKNELKDSGQSATMPPMHYHGQVDSGADSDPCTSGSMSLTSTNLHFHGLTVPAVCHEDEVLKTSIRPGDPPFEYRFRIPANEPPGLYWYHPHIHGFSSVQVMGGASGAMIIEGIERVNKAVAGLPERTLVIRDQSLLNPTAPPSKLEPVVPRNLVESDGDAANNGTGFGKPAKDLSINFVPVPYPNYPPAVIRMRPQEPQLWRVLNASAITYLNLAVLFNRAPQPLGIVALDGVPINENGTAGELVEWENHIGVPPGGRVEFIVTAPPAGVTGLLVTRTVDTGPGGENDPNRALSSILVAGDAPEPQSRLAASSQPLPASSLPWLENVEPVRTRKLYFSEKPRDPNNPNSPTDFFITVEGQTPKVFDPNSDVPAIIAKQGDVEDWIIENRSNELHAFHIHQLHFLLMDWMGVPVNEPFLRDTINVPYYNGKTLAYPSVRLRMDFRDPNTVGTFVFHCHLLEHEDGGMMGLIRVEPAQRSQSLKSNPPPHRATTAMAQLCAIPGPHGDRGH